MAAACALTLPGHAMSRWATLLLERSPWGWSTGVVIDELDLPGGSSQVVVQCPGVAGLTEGGLVELWHHVPLGVPVVAGAEVRVHERHQALAGDFGVISVRVTAGLGCPPDPVDVETWARGEDARVFPLT